MSDAWRREVANPTRLRALARSELLDSAAEDAFDRLTRLSSRLLRAPVCLVSLVDERRQFFKSGVGLEEPWASRRETPLSHSFCKHVVGSGARLVVADARESPLLRDNAAIGELGVVAYAGVPLAVEGQTLGAFCVIDHVARAWTEDELEILSELGRAVAAQIASRGILAELAARERTLDAVLETMPAGVILRDVKGAVTRTNPAVERILGRSAEELATLDLWSITHPDDLEGDARSRDEVLAGEAKVAVRLKRFLHTAGHYVWVQLSAAALRDARGRVEGTVAVIKDVTAEREAEAARLFQARVHRTMVENIPRGAVLLFDRELRYVAADGPELLPSIGLDKSEIEGRSLAEIATSPHRVPLEALYRRVLAGESAEYEGVRQGRILKTRVAPVRDGEQVSGGLALIQDVTEERLQADEILRAKALFEATIANVGDGVGVLDSEYSVVFANRAYAELLDLEPELDKLVGLTRAEFLEHVGARAADRAAFLELMDRARLSSEDDQFEIELARPKHRYLRRRATRFELPDGPGHLVIWQDISAERALLAEREQQALTDMLTGIANRRAAENELARAVALSERSGTPLCVALFDIDHFKRVNDRHGHAAGDDVLRRVASVLAGAKRLTDTVARWGGEEFVAILPVALEGALAFCERIRTCVAEVECPGVGSVTISAGVAERGAHESQDGLLRRADAGLYAAKARGRNRIERGQ
jgi:diguanylate cyclase (GGDEF)-like protein/PAS domain S-box-containing protein